MIQIYGSKGGISLPRRSDDDRHVPATNHPKAQGDRLAANCLIFSDMEELWDGFSQRLIIPMNSVTIPIWPEAARGFVDRWNKQWET